MHWMILPYRRYFDFSGRSRRKEYWLFHLGWVLGLFVCAGVMLAGAPWSDPAANAAPGPVFWLGVAMLVLYMLGSIIPSIAVTVRRFHDQDLSGWMYLISFVPYLGGLVVFVFMCIGGTRGGNRYGPDPKNPETAADVFA